MWNNRRRWIVIFFCCYRFLLKDVWNFFFFLLIMLLILLLRVHCVCVKVQEIQSSRSPPPTSTTEQKTRPPPLHTRYPLVSTSIEDLFYRSLVRTRARSLGSHVPCRGSIIFRLIYGSDRILQVSREGREFAEKSTLPTRNLESQMQSIKFEVRNKVRLELLRKKNPTKLISIDICHPLT